LPSIAASDFASSQPAERRQHQGYEEPALARGVEYRSGRSGADGVDRLALDLGPVSLFEQRRGIADDQLPAFSLAESRVQNPVDVVDRSGRQTALAITPAALQQLGVGFADVDRLQLGEALGAMNRFSRICSYRSWVRGEPNAIGVVTKWAPYMDRKAFCKR